jgi:hypothetical protein
MSSSWRFSKSLASNGSDQKQATQAKKEKVQQTMPNN